MIVSSYISESSSFDLRTLVNLYPLIAYDNWYYPHYEFIHNDKKGLIWAWTCAKEIKYSVDEESALNLSITFPLGLTHYVIFKGIPEFSSIYIYNTAFRTDPRFETYNSSGYVYKADSQTLLLKSRHKSQIEDIRMSYTPVVKAAPAPAPKPAEPAAETTVTENTGDTSTSSSPSTPSPGSGTPGTTEDTVNTETTPSNENTL